MKIRSAMLCDFAQVRGGLLTVVSAGVTRVAHSAYPSRFALQLAMMIEFDVIDVEQAHDVKAVVVSADAQRVAETVVSIPPQQRANAAPGEPVIVPIVIDFSHVPIDSPGQYDVRIAAGDETDLMSVWFGLVGP